MAKGAHQMRIGFACKLILPDKLEYSKHNFTSTTVGWLNKNTSQQYDKLLGILQHNVLALRDALSVVSTWSRPLRMMRIGSEILPLYTHQDFKWFWEQPEVRSYLEVFLSLQGAFARESGIRLSMHPGQFTILNSLNNDVVEKSRKEIEYHAEVARLLGYTEWHQDGFAINIHVGSKQGGIDRFLANSKSLSTQAKNLLTIENDEYSFGIDDVLQLAPHFPIVLDIHHHWCYTQGQYIQANDARIARIIDSWRGIRPKIHYSLSKEDIISSDTLPSFADLNTTRSKLRAHSLMCHNNSLNAWAISHINWADIMVEAKAKNLASHQLYAFFNKNKINSLSE